MAFLGRWLSRKDVPDADQFDPLIEGTVLLAEAPDRRPVSLRLEVKAVGVAPRPTGAWLEVTAADASGEVLLTWMGRRAIAGVTPGRRLRVDGRIASDAGRRRIYNPSYALL